jgi:predicted transcriptional regulator
MELHLTVEAEAKLNQLAQRTRREKDELLEEAINHLIAYNEWLEKEVKESLAAADRGEIVSNEEVRKWLEERERL